MSPILKRDVSETLRQARRLATAVTGATPDEDDDDPDDTGHKLNHNAQGSKWTKPAPDHVFSSGADRRQGIGSENGDVGWEPSVFPETSRHRRSFESNDADEVPAGVERIDDGKELWDYEADVEGERSHMLGAGRPEHGQGWLQELEYEEPLSSTGGSSRHAQLRDLRNLLLGSTPSLLISLVGYVFTGELLEHLARWRVFRRVDELFILVPMIGNLKGNLEMCLSARLGTSANIGELDHRHTRRALLTANMTLLGLQALLISCLAAVLSFVLGLFTVHRLGDVPPGAVAGMNSTMPGSPADPGLAVGEQEWHEGYTRPGWQQLVMVLATGMGSAGLGSAILGSFMSSVIVLCRWCGVDPDNITPPLAACLGDLLTLFILALLGTALVGTMDTPLPLIAVILMTIAAAWFTRRVMKNQWVKKVAKGGWAPLIGAMLISSGTGMALEAGVGKYRGFALLAISMTGLTGAIGGIHANRMSTMLHTALQSPHQSNNGPGLSAKHGMIALGLLAYPCQVCFLMFVSWAGWIDLSLGWAGWACFTLTTIISLASAHYMTLFFWSQDLDPDSYTLPIHSALTDFLGQLLLMVAYEICILQNMDVTVRDAVPPP